jgi:hypothetical protein
MPILRKISTNNLAQVRANGRTWESSGARLGMWNHRDFKSRGICL